MKKLVIAITGVVCLGGFVAARTPAIPSVAWVEAPRFNPAAWLDGGERFPAGAVIRMRDGNGTRALVPQFAASADPSISPDGTHLLFSGKPKPGDPWQIFEIALSGEAALRQITKGDDNCVRPFYLPEDQITYTRMTRAGSWIELTGGQRLTYSGARVLTDDVLQDGRILFETEFHAAVARVREIMTVYPDGTGVEAVRCDHGSDRHSAHQTDSGDVVFVDGGRLARFTPALAHEVAIRGAVPRPAEFAGPIVDSGTGTWIVAVRQNAQAYYRLIEWPTGGQIAAPHNANAVEPVVLAPHDSPRRFPSALVASRTAVNLLCLNAHTSRDPIPPAPIRSVRVFTQVDHGEERLLGQTAVEKDGSFFVQVPADSPIRMEILDAAGRVLRAERNWWWGRPAEQRICVGCHAGPERAPENAVPEVLLRKDVPVKMLAAEENAHVAH